MISDHNIGNEINLWRTVIVVYIVLIVLNIFLRLIFICTDLSGVRICGIVAARLDSVYGDVANASACLLERNGRNSTLCRLGRTGCLCGYAAVDNLFGFQGGNQQFKFHHWKG